MLFSAILSIGYFLLGQARLASAGASVESFQQARAIRLTESPDTSLWSEKRLNAYLQAADNHSGSPIATLSIERVGITAPVFEGASEHILDLGIGRIKGTANFSKAGNVGVAAHRDGYFRGLKDIRVGDQIDVATSDSDLVYRVSGTEIVEPSDTHVLDPSSESQLTLVTCYPFYFVGSAPQRFIVYAELVDKKLFTSPKVKLGN